ncbi:nitrite reductase small subunit NirD [Cohaesibacter sp. CAU 1516]|uniref:nitrite reductase small subunit NirD n=1 Tax=Cohaesibacter sp. CAU 1516 TaxID=2576038 RepID=UPI0010FDCEB8|nr:nitrite reductase small subunit NirD [Cohaesibacter sp. CAU 1516]TLP44903.1 nitrite reductase small subunit NirD [Cohaesibacter sp. CAU 1516]
MNALGNNWVRVGTLDDIPARGSRKLTVGETTIALFRTSADQVFALEDACPHKKGPLSEGIVHDGCVTCPLHNWVISLESGQAQGADEGATKSFPVKLSDQDILIDLTGLGA